MTDIMKILIIYSNHETYLSPHYHHGIAYVMASLKRSGHHTNLLIYDCPVDRETLISDIRSCAPDLVGFSVASNQYKYAKRYSEWIKLDTGLPLMVGGVHATLAPRKVMEHNAWDYLVAGEAEDAVVELAEALETGGDPSRIPNLWLRKGSEIIRNDVRPLVEDLDTLPFPDRESFDLEHLLEGERKVLSFLAGRGCPYMCTYCSNPAFRRLYKDKGPWVRFRSPENLISEIRALLGRYSPNILDFNDDIFTLKPDWLKKFLDYYKKEFALPFRCNVRVETVDKDILRALKEAGCDAIRVGVEQGDEDFRRKKLKRKMSNEQIIRVFDQAHELNLKVWSFNMLGFPDETPELARRTLELNRRLKPDHLQISVFNPYPATELWEECLREGYLPEEAESPDGYFVPETPLNLPTMTHERLKELHRKFVELNEEITDEIRTSQRYGNRKIHYDLADMLDRAEVKQPVEGYVKVTYFTMDEDSRKTLQEHPPSSVAWELKVPPRSRFEAAVAMHPQVREKARGKGPVFELYVTPRRLLGRGKPRLLLSRHLDPKNNPADRGWIEVSADMAEFAGKTVRMELVTRMKDDSESDFNTAGWANPVIVEAH